MADDRMKNDDLQRNMGNADEGQHYGQQSPGRWSGVRQVAARWSDTAVSRTGQLVASRTERDTNWTTMKSSMVAVPGVTPLARIVADRIVN